MIKDKRKLKITFLYTSLNNKFLHTGQKYDDNLFYFYFEGLAKSQRIKFKPIDIQPACVLDYHKIKDSDIVVIDSFAINHIKDLSKLNCPKFLRAPDPYDFNDDFKLFCENNSIEHLFYSPCESSFRRIVDTQLYYHQIIHGIRPAARSKDFELRNDDILFTGCVGNLNDKFYHLRKVIQDAKLTGMQFVSPYNLDTCGEAYRRQLAHHKASVAATRQYFSLKYLEIPAAGTLCFMEDDGLNGIQELGFRDGVNAIFINEDNFEFKFKQFLMKPDCKYYASVAKNGYDLVQIKYANQIQVDKLIDIFYSVV